MSVTFVNPELPPSDSPTSRAQRSSAQASAATPESAARPRTTTPPRTPSLAALRGASSRSATPGSADARPSTGKRPGSSIIRSKDYELTLCVRVRPDSLDDASAACAAHGTVLATAVLEPLCRLHVRVRKLVYDAWFDALCVATGGDFDIEEPEKAAAVRFAPGGSGGAAPGADIWVAGGGSDADGAADVGKQRALVSATAGAFGEPCVCVCVCVVCMFRCACSPLWMLLVLHHLSWWTVTSAGRACADCVPARCLHSQAS
jgi:hypothetical protein